jgi:glycosyltransferase involved in cell wall biosynthesis
MGVHNDVDRVGHAIGSILAQSFRDLEFIVVDDGSDDGTADLLDRIAAADARMRVIHQENTGLTGALIRGCAIARGRYIARQDSDDWSHPERISDQVELIESDPRIGFVSCATQFIGPADEPLLVVSRDPDLRVATQGLLRDRQGPPAHGSVLMRRTAYEGAGGYREQFHFSQDSDLWMRIAADWLIGYVPGVRYVHRKEVASTSGARRAAQVRFAEIGHRCRAAREAGQSEAALLEEAMQLTRELRSERSGRAPPDRSAMLAMSYLLGSQLAKNRDARARSYLYPVLASQPWHWKAWVRLAQSLLLSRKSA